MKIIVIFAAFVLFGCNRGKNYIIEGTIKGRDSGIVSLVGFGDNYPTSRKDTIKDGKFRFEGTIELPEHFSLTYNNPNEIFSIFIEPSSKVKIILNPNNLSYSTINGSKVSEAFNKIEQTRIKEFEKLKLLNQDLNTAIENGDELQQSRIINKGDSISSKLIKWQLNFIRSNPDSHFSAYYLYTLQTFLPQDTLRRYLNLLSTSLNESIYKEQVKTYLSVLPGSHFQDFELRNSENNLIKFSNIAKGKVVLIHFWFSSCSPCRIQNAKLLQIYNLYKTKGFEIVGISTDWDKSDFIKTIHDDRMSWINLIDRSDKTGIQYIYEITSFPSNLLIDRNGIIVKKNIPLEKLDIIIDSLVNI